MKLQEKFEKALEKYVNKIKKNKNVIGILLSGSFVHSEPDKNSDLDVYVLTKDSKFRERGNTWIDGVEIEYFFNPIKQVEEYFKKELKERGPHTSHMFVNSRILFKRGKELNRLIEEAKKVLNKKRPKMSSVSKEISKYQIDDLEKDLEDTFLKKDKAAFSLVANRIIEESLDIFLKDSRVYPEKPKRILVLLKKIDGKFASLFEKALVETNIEKRYSDLIKLTRYIETLIGGKRTKEWKLKSKCTYLKK